MTGRSQCFDLNLMQDELHRSGRQSAAADTVSILKSVDEAIFEEREYVKKTNQCFIALDVVMTMITFIVVFGYDVAMYFVKDYHELTSDRVAFEFVIAAGNGGNAAILAYASWSIRKSILTQSNLKPN